MESKEADEGTIDRLILEIRQLRSMLEDVQNVLYTGKDMDKLTAKGAAAYLVRQNLVLDEIKGVLKRASRKPEDAVNVLCELEEIVRKAGK